MLRKQVFSMIAAAAFLLTIGGTVAAKAVQADTIWEYEDGTLIDVPRCETGEPVCATEYLKLPNGQPDHSNPTGEKAFGKRL